MIKLEELIRAFEQGDGATISKSTEAILKSLRELRDRRSGLIALEDAAIDGARW